MDKRFAIEIVDNPFNDNGLSDVILDNGRVIPLNSVVDLLNELNDENQKLKDKLCELGVSDVKGIDTGLEDWLND